MKVRSEVLIKFRIAVSILAVIIYGVGIAFAVADISVDKSLQMIYWVMFALTTLYVVVVFWPKPIITRWFDLYYNMLSDAEKARFDAEVEKAEKKRYFVTSKELVQKGIGINAIADIKSLQYTESILRTRNMRQRNRVIRLDGDADKKLLPVNVSSREAAEELIQALMERNPNIVRQPDQIER